MTPEQAIRERLLSLVSVTSLVSTRIYQLAIPQSPTWPLILVQLISEPLVTGVDGETTLRRSRVQIDVFVDVRPGGNPYTSAVAISDAVHGNGSAASPTGLQHWKGDVGSPAFAIKGIERLDRDVRYEVDADRVIRIRQDYEVWS